MNLKNLEKIKAIRDRKVQIELTTEQVAVVGASLGAKVDSIEKTLDENKDLSLHELGFLNYELDLCRELAALVAHIMFESEDALVSEADRELIAKGAQEKKAKRSKDDDKEHETCTNRIKAAIERGGGKIKCCTCYPHDNCNLGGDDDE